MTIGGSNKIVFLSRYTLPEVNDWTNLKIMQNYDYKYRIIKHLILDRNS